ncbi:FAD-dependent oxidoreductase [Aeromicrobium chenweiae]|uniref:Cholesterol oxidase n=1 Tax=Aeromicrobium chenweiae TaxID=2079793 RepID=A0A2S0WMQ8_9ACTN|nr:GMC family oxidoreductase [Aeromicrobium chenweiae]AWB92582.1 cholesterol oxidase [Aeromicrobium chenweiae]TGN33570.1 GMC family oxidoreductase [Aeromicrobium chenweiae]
MTQRDYDVIVIGSGFGGSVAALRLTEKGYRVGVLEMGRRFADDELPQTSWRLSRYMWAPWARCFGIMRLTLLKDVLIASGTGVGGGSLVYANTLYEPLDPFYRDRQWAHITDWKDELAPHYVQAKKMLGVSAYPGTTPADDLMSTLAKEYGVGDTFHASDVGVLFGDEPGVDVPDPFFGGAGPARRTCIDCGACMTGCRHNAKNTTVKNYLHLAEGAGAEVHPMTTVTDVRPIASATAGGAPRYEVRTQRTGNRLRRATFTADQVVFAGNALNTQNLLHRLKRRSLPHLSDRIGELSRTNSEAVLSARSSDHDADYTPGVAITSSFHPDEHTHVEPVRYGHGSNALALINMALPDRPGPGGRLRAVVRGYRVLGLRGALRVHKPRRWAEQSIVVLVMQSLDNSITTYLKRGPFGRRMTSKQGVGEPNPPYIPVADRVARDIAERIGGHPGSSIGELAGVPLTAHFLGGCVIGETRDAGVIDPYQRVFGHEGLHISDGSAITANLGVNPSLTITAQSERAMSLWPNKGEADPRPALGAPYVRVEPVAPVRPAVPAGAPAALLLPIPVVPRR